MRSVGVVVVLNLTGGYNAAVGSIPRCTGAFAFCDLSPVGPFSPFPTIFEQKHGDKSRLR